ncbi:MULTISPECIES: CDP-diacylglycerol--serine O-phosphatidyltransferase [unclassified Roseovarius]|uniref:CDP-diacylglycerol--serine O-phosphatidyltransferase n=1 Tax=unclassified Roseovarius TaxID=2614913 RepID=UPI00273D1F1F|nr:CDP-diacylglycerol--serine O-phosphatidyltransferase [Roseovarius sp. MMSF_3350]
MPRDNQTPRNSAGKKRNDAALVQLLPNLITLAAICAGMTSIRFAVQGDYIFAVQLVLLACVLDGIDGRVARFMRSDSKIGAELDSLADFLNFGVAPPLILYFWGLQEIRSVAWIFVLFFTVCCVIRLARFNVDHKVEEAPGPSGHFTGVPSPAGAVLVMVPLYLSFAFETVQVPGLAVCFYMMLAGLLMISTVPTLSLKGASISRSNVKFFLVGVVLAGAAFFTFTWTALSVLSLCYLLMVAWSAVTKARQPGK